MVYPMPQRKKRLPPFDPEGSDYDYETARKSGIQPDPISKHWQSRDPRTGQLLKGRKHKTWDLLVKGEEEAGHEIYKGEDGKYYSQPIQGPSDPLMGPPDPRERQKQARRAEITSKAKAATPPISPQAREKARMQAETDRRKFELDQVKYGNSMMKEEMSRFKMTKELEELTAKEEQFFNAESQRPVEDQVPPAPSIEEDLKRMTPEQAINIQPGSEEFERLLVVGGEKAIEKWREDRQQWARDQTRSTGVYNQGSTKLFEETFSPGQLESRRAALAAGTRSPEAFERLNFLRNAAAEQRAAQFRPPIIPRTQATDFERMAHELRLAEVDNLGKQQQTAEGSRQKALDRASRKSIAEGGYGLRRELDEKLNPLEESQAEANRALAEQRRTPQPKTTTQTQQIQESFDKRLESFAFKLDGATITRHNEILAGTPEYDDPEHQIHDPNPKFKPTEQEAEYIRSEIDDWVNMMVGMTGLSEKALRNMAVSTLRRNYPHIDRRQLTGLAKRQTTKVRVRKPNGETGFIPQSQLEDALSQGYTRIE